MTVVSKHADGPRGDSSDGDHGSLDVNLETTVSVRDQFIPLRKREIVRLISESPHIRVEEKEPFQHLCRILESVFHFEHHESLRSIKDAYSALDPDTALVETGELSDEQIDAKSEILFTEMGKLLQRANYVMMSHDEIKESVEVASEWGGRLNVDFSIFHTLRVYSRGDRVIERPIRRLRNRFRRETIEVPVHQRLVVIFRLNDHSRLGDLDDVRSVYLKMFKNIPKVDLDMLLPGTTVQMTLLDRGKILLPTISGVAVSVAKIVKLVAFTIVAGFWGLVLLLGLIVGTIGYGIKSFFGYLRTKDKYQLTLTRSLYFKNLDSNAGVFFRVLDEAEEQEFREAIIAYFLLWKMAGEDGWTIDELDRQAEDLVHTWIERDVDFEVDDALHKLSRLGMAIADEQGRWTHVPIDQALSKLDQSWDNYFQFHHH